MLHLMGHEMSFVIMCFGSGQKNVATSGATMETLLICASPFWRCIDNAKDRVVKGSRISLLILNILFKY